MLETKQPERKQRTYRLHLRQSLGQRMQHASVDSDRLFETSPIAGFEELWGKRDGVGAEPSSDWIVLGALVKGQGSCQTEMIAKPGPQRHPKLVLVDFQGVIT